jgi:oligopeptide/dipeptide ABC transporter ATP-binding protein
MGYRRLVLQTLQRAARESVSALEIITHDLAVVASFADRVAILYAGRLVEEAAARELVTRPLHPYTKGLLAALPALDRRAARPRGIPGPMPSRVPRTGCAFALRCALRDDVCEASEPAIAEREPGHRVACWHPAVG